MKNDWAFQLAVLAGAVVMVVSVLTFDHDKADRREAREAIAARFTAESVHDFNLWRSLASHLRRTRDVSREVDRWSHDVEEAEACSLDRASLKGVAWYWVALNARGDRDVEPDTRERRYEWALGLAVQELEQSEIDESQFADLRYLRSHYLGRAYARLDNAEAAHAPLSLAMDEMRGLRDAVGVRRAVVYISTLGGSWAMVGDEGRLREAWAESLRLRINETEIDFSSDRFFFRFPVNRSEDRLRILREVAAPLMEAWLVAHGERPNRSWIYLGWLYDRMGQLEDAARAWGRASEAWQAIASSDPSSGNLYNLACASALVGDADAAMSALVRAVEAGYTDASHMEYDRDLVALIDLPGFKGLLDEMRARPTAEAGASDERIID